MTLTSVLSISVLIGTCIAFVFSRHQESPLASLKDGNVHFKKWMFLSLVHVGIVGGYAWCLQYVGILRLEKDGDESFFEGVCIFVLYWVLFESWYTLMHMLQHKLRWFGLLTGHWVHHEMRDPYGPDYLTAFMAHPIDALHVQVAAQIPWVFAYLLGIDMVLSEFLYGTIITWLVYLGVRAHCETALGGYYHVQHHNNPAKGYYSFSGIPEVIYHACC